MITITFTDGNTVLLQEGEFVNREPGWIVVWCYFDDPTFGDMGYTGKRDIVAFPTERVAKVEYAKA